ncbi:hypothetical protein EMIT0232MI5_90328 [Pseudomonas sp. IT-232MI5]
MANVGGVSDELKENASDFLVTYQDIVGPLQSGTLHSKISQSLQNSQPHDKTQPLELPHSAINTQDKTVIEILSKRTHPLATSSPTSRDLSLREYQKGGQTTLADRTQGLSICRVD